MDLDQVILADRQATCTCGVLRPSAGDLAFFEFRGEGSRTALDTCRNCSYAKVAHTDPRPNNKFICAEFVPSGAWRYDSFYCGHAGWD